VADRLALALCDLAITEAGFGAELGAEKFFDIKCRSAGLRPAAAVLVATVRTLRAHGNGGVGPDPEAVRRGCENLARHLGILRTFGVPAVVALNAFPSDGEAERQAALRAAAEAGARAAVVACPFSDGGAGALELAAEVRKAAAEGAPDFRLLYEDSLPIPAKVEAVATRIYGAEGVDWLDGSAAEAEELACLGQGSLPVCMAKTHLSISHDPALGPSPRGFRLPVRRVTLEAGAGFAAVVSGPIRLMPGLPVHPAAEEIDVEPDGTVTGLR
jgi:formyltetrahydrofolate synthetase